MAHCALVSALLTVILALTPAVASADGDLPDIREQRRQKAPELRDLLTGVEKVSASVVSGEDEVARLRARQQQLAVEKGALEQDLRDVVRSAVMRGGLSDGMAVLAAAHPADAVDRAQLVAVMAHRDTAAAEEVVSAGRQQARLIEIISARVDELRERRNEVKQASAKVSARLDDLRIIERRLERARADGKPTPRPGPLLRLLVRRREVTPASRPGRTRSSTPGAPHAPAVAVTRAPM